MSESLKKFIGKRNQPFLTWRLSDIKTEYKEKRPLFGWQQVRTPQSKDVLLYPYKNGAAYSSGIRDGDILLSINGQSEVILIIVFKLCFHFLLWLCL